MRENRHSNSRSRTPSNANTYQSKSVDVQYYRLGKDTNSLVGNRFFGGFVVINPHFLIYFYGMHNHGLHNNIGFYDIVYDRWLRSCTSSSDTSNAIAANSSRTGAGVSDYKDGQRDGHKDNYYRDHQGRNGKDWNSSDFKDPNAASSFAYTSFNPTPTTLAIYMWGGSTDIPGEKNVVLKNDLSLWQVDLGQKKSEILESKTFFVNVNARNPPPPMVGASLVAYDSKLYLFGGLGANDKVSNTLYIFDPKTNAWSAALNRSGRYWPAKRSGHTAVVVADSMFVYGGATLSSIPAIELIQELDIYEFKTRVWRKVKCPKQGRTIHTCVYFDGSLWIYGGFIRESSRYGDTSDPKEKDALSEEMFRFDVANETWHSLYQKGQPYGRAGHCSVVIDNQMIIMGGLKFQKDRKTQPFWACWEMFSIYLKNTGAPTNMFCQSKSQLMRMTWDFPETIIPIRVNIEYKQKDSPDDNWSMFYRGYETLADLDFGSAASKLQSDVQYSFRISDFSTFGDYNPKNYIYCDVKYLREKKLFQTAPGFVSARFSTASLNRSNNDHIIIINSTVINCRDQFYRIVMNHNSLDVAKKVTLMKRKWQTIIPLSITQELDSCNSVRVGIRSIQSSFEKVKGNFWDPDPSLDWYFAIFWGDSDNEFCGCSKWVKIPKKAIEQWNSESQNGKSVGEEEEEIEVEGGDSKSLGSLAIPVAKEPGSLILLSGNSSLSIESGQILESAMIESGQISENGQILTDDMDVDHVAPHKLKYENPIVSGPNVIEESTPERSTSSLGAKPPSEYLHKLELSSGPPSPVHPAFSPLEVEVKPKSEGGDKAIPRGEDENNGTKRKAESPVKDIDSRRKEEKTGRKVARKTNRSPELQKTIESPGPKSKPTSSQDDVIFINSDVIDIQDPDIKRMLNMLGSKKGFEFNLRFGSKIDILQEGEYYTGRPLYYFPMHERSSWGLYISIDGWAAKFNQKLDLSLQSDLDRIRAFESTASRVKSESLSKLKSGCGLNQLEKSTLVENRVMVYWKE